MERDFLHDATHNKKRNFYIWDRATIEKLVWIRRAKFISKEDIEAYQESEGMAGVSAISFVANFYWFHKTT
jgi:hypothetical protein